MSDDDNDLDPTELPTTATGPIPETHPRQIGPYRLLQRLGEGGMGEVWEAEQTEPVRRKVALKLIKLGMDTKQVVARFEAERQALAIMNHPSVAKVFDAGVTEQGRPFFAMELVPGIPMTKYCDKHRLSTRERLDLFRQVCAGIHHAHQKGIIHRDIKPSNVLVTVQDGVPVPKIIDFGIAKATTARLTESTIFTEHGRLIGTPEYMSPEQAEMTALDVDTTTDIYSLGVLLYELLTGVLPFDSKTLRRAAEHEIRRIIREEEPSKPSTRLSSLGATASEVAARRRTDVGELQKRLRGDLDWIVMRAMEKDRTRRYPSASELAADVTRHLTDEPVVARPPSLAYRFRKLAVRNRGPVVAASVVLVTLVAAVVVSTVFGLQAESRRKETEGLRKEAVWQSYVANMAAASASFRLKHIREAKHHLSRCPAEHRGWEWFHLNKRIDRSRATIVGPYHYVSAVTFSPDGMRIASGHDGTVRLWDAASGKAQAVLEGQIGWVYSVAFSPDGTRIASGNDDQTIRLWDVTSGETVGTLVGHQGGVNSIAFSEDGNYIASTSWDQTVRLWDVRSSETILTFVGHEDPVYSIAFSPNGKRIASASSDDTIRLWDAASGELVSTFRGHDGDVMSVAFSPDGKQIVSGSADRTVRLWDTATSKLRTILAGHDDAVSSVSFSPDGTSVVSGSWDNAVRLWDAASGDLLATFWGHDTGVVSLAFSPDGKQFVSGSYDNTIRLWDATLGELPAVIRGHEGLVSSVAFSPDATRIASSSHDKTVRLWAAASGDLTTTLVGHEGFVDSVAFSPDGTRIASGSRDMTVRMWDAASGRLLQTLAGHESSVLSVAFSQDGARIASGSGDGTVRLWDAVSGKLLQTLHESYVSSVAFSPDGARIASGSGDGTVRLWDAASGELVATLSGHELDTGSWRSAVVFSHDGTQIVSTSPSALRVWNATSGKLLRELPRGGWAMDASFSPDGKRIASVSMQDLRLWDAASGELLATFVFAEDDARLYSVAFSPDGTRIATACEDHAIRIWDGAPN